MARDRTTYEWHVECRDEHGDANNIDFADTFAEALASQKAWASDPDYAKIEIALVRTEGNELDGINWRGYAYVQADGTLEERFSTFHEETGPANDGPDVPQRFHKEVQAARK